MDETKLEIWVKKIVETGPTRVVVNASGEATTPEKAERDYQVKPTIIYIRNDGWSLGTPPQFDTVASNLWRNEWVAVAWRDVPNGWRWRRWGTNEQPKEVVP